MTFLNELEVDVKRMILIAVVLLIAFIISRTLRWTINKAYNKAIGSSKLDLTRLRFFKNALTFIIWLVALGTVISLIPQLKSLAVTLFAGAGILVAIIGFAAQEAFSNIVGGIFIVMFRPFRVGDMIKVGSRDYGIVEDITLRHTIILNFENKRVIVPNAVINSDTVINDSIQDTIICRFIEVGISYDSSIELATRIIQEEAIKHPLCIDRRSHSDQIELVDQVEVRLVSFGDFSVNLKAYVWTNDPLNVFRMHSDINKAIKKRFDAEGIVIPFPHRTVIMKDNNPQKLNKKPS